jgi:hypothetical protein
MNNEFIERWKMILPDAVPMAHRLARLKWGTFAHDADLFEAIADTVEEVDGNV